MLKILRKKGVAKKILWFVAVIIIISFGFFGPSYRGRERVAANYAGKIFGRTVSFQEFERSYQEAQIQALMRFGDNFNKIKPYLNIDAEAWDRLILSSEAQKRNIKVSDDEVIAAVEKFPFFQKNGQFDTLMYNDVLKYVFRVKPREFEEGVRDDLKVKKLYDQETTEVKLTEEFILAEYQKAHEKIKASYIFIPAKNFESQITVDESKAPAYYETHKNEFFSPASVNVEYIVLPLAPQIKPEDAGKIKEQAQTIREELTSNPDFAAVAQKYNLTAEESGFFSLDQPNLKLGWSFEVLQKIFQMKEGEISLPIQTPTGYQILRIKKKQDAQVQTFAEAKDKVIETLKLQEAKKEAQKKTQEYLNQIKAAFDKVKMPDFVETAHTLGLDVAQTPAFARGEYLPQIGVSKEFQDAAISLNDANRLSEVVDAGQGAAIVFLDERLPVDSSQYAKDKEAFAKSLYLEKANETFSAFLTHLRLKANLQDNISKMKKADNG